MPKEPAPPVSSSDNPALTLGPPETAAMRAATDLPSPGSPQPGDGTNDPPIPIVNTSQPALKIGDFTTKEACAKALATQLYANYMENLEPPRSVSLQIGLTISPTHFCAALAALHTHDATTPTILQICTNVARTQRKTNPAEWARLATNKLNAINIANVATQAINLGATNTKLATAAYSTFHKIAL